MKNQKSMLKSLIVLCATGLLFSCNQQSMDPSQKLDEVFIPDGYVQSENYSADTKTRLNELKLKNPGIPYFFLEIEGGPVSSASEFMFPQKELVIEYAEQNAEPTELPKFSGVIVKKITGDWKKERFKYYDTQPQAVGGMKEFFAVIQKNLKYPEDAKKAGVQGKVFVEFVVSETGELTEVKAVKGIGYGCDEEAVRVISEAPKWIPAKIVGMNVSVRMILPLTYRLGEK